MDKFISLVNEVDEKFRTLLNTARKENKNNPLKYLWKLIEFEDVIGDLVCDHRIWNYCPQDAGIENRSLPFYQLLDKEISLTEEDLLNEYLNKNYTFGEIKDYLILYPVKFHLLEKMTDRDAFELVYQNAKDQLSLPYNETWSEWIFLLAHFADNEEFLKKICPFLENAFETLKLAAMGNPDDKMINHIAFNALCWLIGRTGLEKYGPLLMEAFIFAVKRGKEFENEKEREIADFYELNLTGGTAAIGLSALNFQGSLEPFDKFLNEYEWRYKGDQFVMEVRYAKWVLSDDEKGALEYLENSENKKGLSYAACALADLCSFSSVDIIKRRMKELKNPVTKEVLKEAVERMERGFVPELYERMIWMFGNSTSSEIATGAESNNVFLLRAKEKTCDPEIGIVFETDNSADEDI